MFSQNNKNWVLLLKNNTVRILLGSLHMKRVMQMGNV